MDRSSFIGKLDDKKYMSLAGGKISISQAKQELKELLDLGYLEETSKGWKIVLPKKNFSIFSKIFEDLEKKQDRD